MALDKALLQSADLQFLSRHSAKSALAKAIGGQSALKSGHSGHSHSAAYAHKWMH